MNSAAIPAGWYPDGHGNQRWWDGTEWTEHTAVSTPSTKEPPSRATRRAQREASHATSVSASPNATGTDFSGRPIDKLSKREARMLAADLIGAVNRHDMRAFDDIDAYRSQVEADIARAHADAISDASKMRAGAEELAQKIVTEAEARMNQLSSEIAEAEVRQSELRSENWGLQQAVLDMRATAILQENGLFDYEHAAEHSATLSADLEALRAKIKTMVREKKATTATTSFTFNNSTAKGKKFVNDMSKILLRAFNAEAENCVKTMRAGNLDAAQKRLTKVAEQIAKQGDMINLRITSEYLRLRLQELSLASRHLQAVQTEKEAERERRAELREQAKAQAELEREHARLDREREKYMNSMLALEASGDAEGVERMRARIIDVDKAIEDVDYRVANMRAGYVYVISNVGAFGPDMVKIGMTRRLEPMDRVRELGDASVPFRFDVHAMFFADDAVAIETMLHQRFAEQRVNKINTRREYFRVTPEEVLDTLKSHSVEVLEYTVEPQAEEFRLSGGLVP